MAFVIPNSVNFREQKVRPRKRQNVGEGADHQCFCKSWNSLEQAVTASEDRSEQLFDGVALADNDLG